MTDQNELIRKYVLQNAIFYDGTANPKSVLGKVLAENPDLKKDVPSTLKQINEIVNEVNSLGLDKQKEELESLDPSLLEKKKEEQELKFPDLPENVTNDLVSLFPPEPSKYSHIGHAKGAYINYWYSKKYNGKFILRFEDNNPKLSKHEYVDAILNDFNWLEVKPDQVDFVSDHMDEIYSITEDLIQRNELYLCSCPKEKVSDLRFKGEACEHRDQPVETNIELWNKMVEGNVSDITIRIKIDIAHQNSAMRDPAIMRVDKSEHFRVGRKYNVWPLYDYATSIMDKIEGITFRVRSKEFEMRAPLQAHIHGLIGYDSPYTDEIARFNLEGSVSSGRKIREMIENGEMSGWDDPRLTTIMALRKRGYVPDALKEFLISTGMSKTESTISWDVLNSINRKYIDPISNRYFFVNDPVEIEIENLPEKEFTEAPLNPKNENKKVRKIPIGKKFYVDRKDFDKLKGKEVRLLHLSNVILDEKSTYTDNEIKDIPKIHWVSSENIKTELIMDDSSVTSGLVEPDIFNESESSHVQFERFGYVHIINTKPLRACFTHK